MAAPDQPPGEVASYEECLAQLEAAREKIENLQAALVTGRRIGTAVGIIMATYKVTDEAAFDMLVMASQSSHRKLRDIAGDVVETGDLQSVDVPGAQTPRSS